jgi:hypothetical protein
MEQKTDITQDEPEFNNERFDEAITRAWVDEEYRKRLIANPKQSLGEMGVELPKAVRVTVHEFDVNDRHIFLPPLASPPEAASLEPARETTRPPGAIAATPRPEGSFRFGIARAFLPEPIGERSENNG